MRGFILLSALVFIGGCGSEQARTTDQQLAQAVQRAETAERRADAAERRERRETLALENMQRERDAARQTLADEEAEFQRARESLHARIRELESGPKTMSQEARTQETPSTLAPTSATPSAQSMAVLDELKSSYVDIKTSVGDPALQLDLGIFLDQAKGYLEACNEFVELWQNTIEAPEFRSQPGHVALSHAAKTFKRAIVPDSLLGSEQCVQAAEHILATMHDGHMVSDYALGRLDDIESASRDIRIAVLNPEFLMREWAAPDYLKADNNQLFAVYCAHVTKLGKRLQQAMHDLEDIMPDNAGDPKRAAELATRRAQAQREIEPEAPAHGAKSGATADK